MRLMFEICFVFVFFYRLQTNISDHFFRIISVVHNSTQFSLWIYEWIEKKNFLLLRHLIFFPIIWILEEELILFVSLAITTKLHQSFTACVHNFDWFQHRFSLFLPADIQRCSQQSSVRIMEVFFFFFFFINVQLLDLDIYCFYC